MRKDWKGGGASRWKRRRDVERGGEGERLEGGMKRRKEGLRKWKRKSKSRGGGKLKKDEEIENDKKWKQKQPKSRKKKREKK